MKREQNIPIKIRRLKVKNYKGFDKFEMDFPVPKLPGDPDIMVMGSKNGLGKTSVMECCSLLLIALSIKENQFMIKDSYSMIDIPDLLIRAEAKTSEISGEITIGEKNLTLTIRIDREGIVKIFRENTIHEILKTKDLYEPYSDTENLIKAICGLLPNPVIEKTFLLFHSYRKVQEGNPELGMMIGYPKRVGIIRQYSPNLAYMSEFKLQILHALMNKANLFELKEDQKPDETIDKLNELVKYYAGGTISKLRPSADNTVDIRISINDGQDSMTFDGLSSGQKEIISTLFMIWYHTRGNPSVVFIDEPELHLNAQWHRSFVNRLIKLAPDNQYIIATHSEDVMDSVEKDRRVLLTDK
ncbi:AAA ATPase-like domain-containing protein [Desulfonema limicola]|uniref:AAA ATPase-like domain-containing protein n=1 Tax=Desulfonema limicola TaxID=45656 RepID=A0A975B5R0_9BACT|nr:AAA family ATPase [Desulfonema limicola]QTA79278.1 AAA ATPase-like domain-containing protein [Desulfonema limicola]